MKIVKNTLMCSIDSKKKKKKKQKNVVSDKSHKLLTRKDREIFNEQYKSGGIIR